MGRIADIVNERIAPTDVDIRVQDEGTIFLLWGISTAGSTWLNDEDRFDPDAQRWGGALVVEHRFAEDIINGAREDGLVIGRF